MKYVPEIEEERFQSMVAVPVPARSGEVLGVVVLHTVAPREFDEGVLTFLSHTASLVAGRDRERPPLRGVAPPRRGADPPDRAGPADRRRRAPRRALPRRSPRACAGCSGPTLCQLYEFDAEGGRLELVAADPADRAAPWSGGEGAATLLDLVRRVGRRSGAARRPAGEDGALLALPVEAGDEPLGVLAVGARAAVRRRGGRAAARGRQPARGGAGEDAADRAPDRREHRPRPLRRAGRRRRRRRRGARPRGGLRPRAPVRGRARRCRPRARRADRPWPVVAERAEAGLRAACARHALRRRPRAACGRSCRCRARATRRGSPSSARSSRRSAPSSGLAFGLSAAPAWRRRRRARHPRGAGRRADRAGAASRGGGAIAYEALGAYKYLVHLRLDDAPARPPLDRDRATARVRHPAAHPAGRHARALPAGAAQRHHDRPRALHPPQHAAPAARPHRAAHRARARLRGPARAGARGQARPAASRRPRGSAGRAEVWTKEPWNRFRERATLCPCTT